METCDCNCECKSAKRHMPINIHNSAGLSSISYRVGTHAHFKSDMLASIASKPSLSKLTTRNDSDLSIALMDGWATVADVLTFYQERIANEGFLRTATERMSILELAREIGYKLQPGVSASTYLTFTMDNTVGSPEKTIVSIGAKVQSIPSSQDEKPQTFETVEEIQTRQSWNEMRPLMAKDQDLYNALTEGKLIFQGTSTKLKNGDGLLFVIGGKPVAFRVIDRLKLEVESQQTSAAFSSKRDTVRPTKKEVSGTTVSSNSNKGTATAARIDNESGFTKADLQYVLSKSWTEPELQAQSELKGWSVDQIVQAVNSERIKEHEEGDKNGHEEDGVYALRIKCSVFGNNAPRWSSLPAAHRYGATIDGRKVEAIYAYDWDKGTDINTDSQGKSYGSGLLFLDNTYAGIAKESWMVVCDPDLYSVYRVISTTERTLTEFSLNAKATGLTVEERYLFTWEHIPGNDYDERLLRDFLRDKLGLEWIDEKTVFKKEDRGKLITAEAGNSSLSIRYQSNAVATLGINSSQGSSWSKWYKFSGIANEVTVAIKQDGNPDVFILGEDNSIHHRWFREHDLHWSGWDKLGEDAKSLAVITTTDGKLQIFVTDGSSTIRTKKQTRADGNWQPWENVSAPKGIQQLAAVLGSQGKIFLFALLQDGRVLYRSSPFEASTWEQVLTIAPRASAISVKRISVAAAKGGSIVLFFIANSGDIYVKELLSPTGTWGNSEKLHQQAATDIAAIITAEDSSVGALIIGTDRNIYSISKSASGWISSVLIQAKDGPVEPVKLAAAVNKRGALEIFAINSLNSALYHKWQLKPVQFVLRKNGNNENTLVYENYLGNFDFRETTVYASPEKLDLARTAIEQSVGGMEIVLDRMVGYLIEGRPVLVAGELYDQPGIIKKEIAFISSVVHLEAGKITTLKLSKSLAYRYKRETVRINANIASATHGETKEEPIGSGDPTQRFQEFKLKQRPLTFISASSLSGVASTLSVTVDGIEWREATSFEDLSENDRAYVTHTDNEGNTYIIFGDGIKGRLPQAGRENIKARYRVGIGFEGLLEADQLSLLMKKPLGIRGVTNPLRTVAGADAEKLDDARINAPRTVLTLDRIVSLEDFKSFAQGFAGIGKATSYTVQIGGIDIVVVAVASSHGEVVPSSSDLYLNLVDAIELYKDPSTPFLVRSFNKRLFDIRAKILVASDRSFEEISEKVKDLLKEVFSFANRAFGQAVIKSEVISVIQRVDGVLAVDIESLHDHELNDGAVEIIRARSRPDEYSNLIPSVPIPSLQVINEQEIIIEEMQQ